MQKAKRAARKKPAVRKQAAKKQTVTKIEPVVHYSQGVTLNLGNYNSIKVAIGIDLPFDGVTDKSVDDTLERARVFVSDKIRTEVDAIKAHRKEVE